MPLIGTENATDKAKTEGLDFEEFLRLLSDPKKQGGMASWYAKSKQLVKTYSDKKTAALASSLQIKHKKMDQDDDALDSFINKGERCVQCHQNFREDENNDSACSYHPGPSTMHTGVENYMDRVTYKCCGAEQIGTNPVLTAAPACATGRHKTKAQQIEEMKKNQGQ